MSKKVDGHQIFSAKLASRSQKL